MLVKSFSDAGVTNPCICFNAAEDALTFLKNTSGKILMIISDLNMPLMDGLSFKRYINDDAQLREKSIPFIFLSTAVSEFVVAQAHRLFPQGYFQKPSSVERWLAMTKVIVHYWEMNILPQNVNFKTIASLNFCFPILNCLKHIVLFKCGTEYIFNSSVLQEI